MEVYVPQEDSFLLEKAILKEDLKEKNCLDLGTGNGIQTKAMFKSGAKKVTAVDINPDAIKKARENNKQEKEITFFEGDLFRFIHNNPSERFDFVAFNPPYVPSDEIKWKDLDGGKKGREIIDVFLSEFEKILGPKGIVLLLVSSLNKPEEIISLLSKKSFKAKIIEKQKLFFEELLVLKITRIK